MSLAASTASGKPPLPTTVGLIASSGPVADLFLGEDDDSPMELRPSTSSSGDSHCNSTPGIMTSHGSGDGVIRNTDSNTMITSSPLGEGCASTPVKRRSTTTSPATCRPQSSHDHLLSPVLSMSQCSSHEDDVTASSTSLPSVVVQPASPGIRLHDVTCPSADNDHLDDTGALTHGSSEESFTRNWASAGLDEAKDQTIARLQEDLRRAHEELKSKDDKCSKLADMQGTVDREIHELTANLFQEAHKMVTEANVKRVSAEKGRHEANTKIDVLQAELGALKLLVLNSTPSSSPRKSFGFGAPPGDNGGPSTSHHRRNLSDATTLKRSQEELDEQNKIQKQLDFKDIEPRYHSEFVGWREKCDASDKDHPFLQRIYSEDILPCLSFTNRGLAAATLSNIENNTIIVEQVTEKKIPTKTCALSCVPRFCTFRLKCEESGDWHHISQSCRNRIAAVCDFFTYLRYIKQGLIKAGVHDTYWEIIRLRKNMAMARLGLGFVSSSATSIN